MTDRAIVIRFDMPGSDGVVFNRDSVKSGEVVYYSAGRMGDPTAAVARVPLEIDDSGVFVRVSEAMERDMKCAGFMGNAPNECQIGYVVEAMRSPTEEESARGVDRVIERAKVIEVSIAPSRPRA